MKREESGIYLMRIEINLGDSNRLNEDRGGDTRLEKRTRLGRIIRDETFFAKCGLNRAGESTETGMSDRRRK